MPFSAGLYYFIHGLENLSRRPAILIHGAGGTHLNWPPQVRRLEDQRVIAPDLPGHGKSEGVGRQHISEYVSDIIRFLDALRLPEVILVGHSMGAGIALSLALEFPARVMGMALLGSSPQLQVSPRLLQAASDFSSFRSAVRMVTSYSYGPRADSRLVDLAEERMAQTRPSVFYGDFLACDSFNVADRVGEIVVPTLILAGEMDRMTPLKYSRFLYEHMARAQLHTLPDAGHMLMLEQPEIVASLLSAFFNSIHGLPS